MDTTAIVIGAGQAGLATSACLTARGVDHVVLDRHGVASAWFDERWDSLRLLTPNWMTRLPGWSYEGDDPDGFMTAGDLARSLAAYARMVDAPVHAPVAVQRVRRVTDGFVVTTDHGVLRCRTVVDATGATGRPAVPAMAAALPAHVAQLTPTRYRNPAQVSPGPVLVVGASASGVQLADELARSGRRVTLAVGRHTRLPRTYRGMDIHWWLERLGVLDRRHDDVGDLDAARREPSLQLVGSPERRDVDLSTLAHRGVRLVGRVTGVEAGCVRLADDLAATSGAADRRLGGLLDRIDTWAHDAGLDPELDPPDRPQPVRPRTSPSHLPTSAHDTVLWATGFRPHHPWLPAAALDERGAVRHDGGVATMHGLYVVGQPFLRRRRSTFVGGVGEDAAAVVDHLVGSLGGGRSVRAGSDRRTRVDVDPRPRLARTRDVR